jgi:hypothetical protein
MRVRASGVAAGWAVAVVAATTVSWVGVSLVGDEVSPAGPAALSQAEVQRRIQAARTGPGAAGQGTAGSSPTAGSPGAGTPGTPGAPRTPGTPGATAGGTGTPLGSPGAGPSAASPSTTQRSVVGLGGSVVLTCAGGRLTFRASPAPGFSLAEDTAQSAERATIAFSDGRHVSRIEAVCASGVLTVTLDERAGGED